MPQNDPHPEARGPPFWAPVLVSHWLQTAPRAEVSGVISGKVASFNSEQFSRKQSSLWMTGTTTQTQVCCIQNPLSLNSTLYQISAAWACPRTFRLHAPGLPVAPHHFLLYWIFHLLSHSTSCTSCPLSALIHPGLGTLPTFLHFPQRAQAGVSFLQQIFLNASPVREGGDSTVLANESWAPSVTAHMAQSSHRGVLTKLTCLWAWVIFSSSFSLYWALFIPSPFLLGPTLPSSPFINSASHLSFLHSNLGLS